MENRTLHLISLSLVSCLLLLFIEQGIEASYIVKTVSKIGLFVFIPVIYIKYIFRENLSTFLNVKKIDFPRLKVGFLAGIGSFVILIVSFILLEEWIDTTGIILDLNQRLGITYETFIWVALYITFGNSFIEEFYFRGVLFLKIYQEGDKLLAYIFSAGLFAFYHVAIFALWFNVWLIGLALLGLFAIGLIFNWLNTKSNNFLNSWITHVLADVAIVAIGYYLFATIQI
ncbi:CPBP family intramembrane metalloprotease [Halalkalibacillus sediminis]|uniref:CPBP family intramembrane metalloprotease n=1 Tax=Halalkalibacillus sediminis TaxID=2018042 RepID=A0A2I0QVT4_9BACI|nr:CPBP family intramembrane glutamic endopeptidase [Halalkalibacillus sediminis]PKR78409.1 CPBP family intramembrane metalloprotease [Halalkalibacillus sediminis]